MHLSEGIDYHIQEIAIHLLWRRWIDTITDTYFLLVVFMRHVWYFWWKQNGFLSWKRQEDIGCWKKWIEIVTHVCWHPLGWPDKSFDVHIKGRTLLKKRIREIFEILQKSPGIGPSTQQPIHAILWPTVPPGMCHDDYLLMSGYY